MTRFLTIKMDDFIFARSPFPLIPRIFYMLIYIEIYTREGSIYIFYRVYIYKIGGTGTYLGNGHIFFIISLKDGEEHC